MNLCTTVFNAKRTGPSVASSWETQRVVNACHFARKAKSVQKIPKKKVERSGLQSVDLFEDSSSD